MEGVSNNIPDEGGYGRIETAAMVYSARTRLVMFGGRKKCTVWSLSCGWVRCRFARGVWFSFRLMACWYWRIKS